MRRLSIRKVVNIKPRVHLVYTALLVIIALGVIWMYTLMSTDQSATNNPVEDTPSAQSTLDKLQSELQNIAYSINRDSLDTGMAEYTALVTQIEDKDQQASMYMDLSRICISKMMVGCALEAVDKYEEVAGRTDYSLIVRARLLYGTSGEGYVTALNDVITYLDGLSELTEYQQEVKKEAEDRLSAVSQN
ncbi:hypothetical protein KC867_00010 [Candidatus Saccharibacteria bacterium]|nr:hypothetical protein [Candidatus Saccharibacteria bacterium]